MNDGPVDDGQSPGGVPDAGTGRPVLRVVHGDPSAEELAALVTVLAAAGGSRSEHGGSARSNSAWTDRARLVGAPPAPGPGAWRASALPS